MINLQHNFLGNGETRKIMLARGGERQPGQPQGLSKKRATKNATAQYDCGARLLIGIPLPISRKPITCALSQKAKDRQMLFLTVYLFG